MAFPTFCGSDLPRAETHFSFLTIHAAESLCDEKMDTIPVWKTRAQTDEDGRVRQLRQLSFLVVKSNRKVSSRPMVLPASISFRLTSMLERIAI